MDQRMLTARESRRNTLDVIYCGLDEVGTQLSSADLDKLSIQRSSMSLEGHDAPIFFAPYTGPIEDPECDREFEFEDPERFSCLNHYFSNCKLPDVDTKPGGVEYNIS
ncbi:hypothetical protein BJX99DRAFT_66583 [Aspergillus californicus]